MRTHTSNSQLFRFLAAGGRRVAAAGAVAVLGVALAGTAVAGPATLSPQLEPRLVGPVHWTSTSGDTHFLSTVLEPAEAAAQYAASSFEWSERSDAPCWAKLGLRSLTGNEGVRALLTRCAEHEASRKSVWRGGANEVITGMQVCLTDKASSAKNRLKGVRLWGRTVDPETAALGPVNGPSHAERKHCNKWSRRVNCPAGEVVAKFKIYGLTNTVGDSIKGISLGCRAVEMRTAIRPATLQGAD